MAGTAIVTIRNKQWQMYLATQPWEIATGLSGVSAINPNTGVFFDIGYERQITVTTVPMLFSIDVAFISSNFVIVDIARDVAPGNLIASDVPARYFLEVNAGELEGIDTGDRVSVSMYPALVTDSWPVLYSSIVYMGVTIMVLSLVVSVVKGLTKPILAESEVGYLPQTGKRTVLYEVNLEAPKHVEEVVLLDDTRAILRRYGKPIIIFCPTIHQVDKIREGKGTIYIYSDQVIERPTEPCQAPTRT